MVIKKANKGSPVAVLNKRAYLTEVYRQLTDDRFHKKLDSDPSEDFSVLITDILNGTYENKMNKICVHVYETLGPTNCKPGQFFSASKNPHFYR